MLIHDAQHKKYKLTWMPGYSMMVSIISLQGMPSLINAVKYIEAHPDCTGLTLENGVQIERV